MESNDTDSNDMSSIEFTLEDTYEHLKDLKNIKEQEVQELMNIIQNNECNALQPNITSEEIRHKRLMFVQSLNKFVEQEQPRDYPVPGTLDFYNDALKELEEEVKAMEELDKVTDEEIKELEADIVYLENKITSLEEIKEASRSAVYESNNFEAEMVVTRRLFHEVKKDLEIVVDILFPQNEGFQELLCVLTRALTKGGDDLYIDVTPNILDFVNFLEEADIIQFHPNIKTKIKLMNM